MLNVSGEFVLEGVQEILQNGEVIQSKTVISKGKGLFKRTFLLPINLLKVDTVNAAVLKAQKERTTVHLHLDMDDVSPVGWLTFDCRVVRSVQVPLTEEHIKQFVSSKSVSKS